MPINPLILGQTQRAELRTLRELAARHPVDMPTVVQQLETADGKRRHMHQMNSQTIDIPLDYMVTFSIEVGHPIGTCRHMSMSSGRKGRTPRPESVWMIAVELGFVGGLDTCTLWPEELQRGDEKKVAINVVQPISTTPGNA